LGLPNAGKSSLVRAVSNATPKVADYPFTTLRPYLGVVRVDELQSFVVADIPGLIEGASEGAGLGHRFLKHLSRTAVLWHVVDLSRDQVIDDIQTIAHELASYESELLEKPRWLIFNKIDLVVDAEKMVKVVLKKLKWKGPVYLISAKNKAGLMPLCSETMSFFHEKKSV